MENICVRYAGEFVLTREGNIDFGEITREIAQKIRRQAGKIRLRMGEQLGQAGDYGEKHIERKDRMQELLSNGYKNARDLVQEAAQNFDAIYYGESGRLILYKKHIYKGSSIYIELISSDECEYYDVKTGMVIRDSYFNNKKPLWEKTQSG